jgi:hypothetical protein
MIQTSYSFSSALTSLPITPYMLAPANWLTVNFPIVKALQGSSRRGFLTHFVNAEQRGGDPCFTEQRAALVTVNMIAIEKPGEGLWS